MYVRTGSRAQPHAFAHVHLDRWEKGRLQRTNDMEGECAEKEDKARDLEWIWGSITFEEDSEVRKTSVQANVQQDEEQWWNLRLYKYRRSRRQYWHTCTCVYSTGDVPECRQQEEIAGFKNRVSSRKLHRVCTDIRSFEPLEPLHLLVRDIRVHQGNLSIFLCVTCEYFRGYLSVYLFVRFKDWVSSRKWHTRALGIPLYLPSCVCVIQVQDT